MVIKGSEKKIKEVNIDAIGNMGMAYGPDKKDEKVPADITK